MDVRGKLVELFYDNNVRCDQKIEELADDVMNIIAHGVTVQKHGRWLLDGRCSECLENPLTTHKTYCPSCGAKMDLER